MPYSLNGKVAVVTGAGAGIGEAIAKKFCYEGAKIIAVDLPDSSIQDVVNEIKKSGGQAVAFVGDVSQPQIAKSVIQKAIDEYGKLDILINNAGTLANMSPLEKYDDQDFQNLINNNIHTVYYMTKYALPHLQKSKDNIISAGSEAGLNGMMSDAPYGASKGWIHAFMKGVAVEQAKHGVRANCVLPGPIDTEMTHASTGPMDKKTEVMSIASTPLGRRGTPEEMANVYAFLASDEASYVTGALWLADGGITPAHGPVGAEAERSTKHQPEGELDTKHSVEPNEFSRR